MMKKLLLLAALLCLCLTLCACGQTTASTMLAPATLVPGVDAVLPAPQPPEEMTRRDTATLYFRYMDEPYLAQELRTVALSPARPYEQTLISALLAGPTGHDLASPFPNGVQVLSTARQGRTLFVTLSAEIMNPMPDEPASWQDDPAWQKEVPLRRELCMQSIVATVTENCDVDRVQILVQQDTALTGSLRLEKRYFMTGEEGLTEPLTRRDGLILTPQRTMDVILTLVQQRDWARLYKYIARQDGDAARPAYTDFVKTMEALPALTDSRFTGGSISQWGQYATFTADAFLRFRDGAAVENAGCILRLTLEDGLWRIAASQLSAWMEVSP